MTVVHDVFYFARGWTACSELLPPLATSDIFARRIEDERSCTAGSTCATGQPPYDGLVNGLHSPE